MREAAATQRVPLVCMAAGGAGPIGTTAGTSNVRWQAAQQASLSAALPGTVATLTCGPATGPRQSFPNGSPGACSCSTALGSSGPRWSKSKRRTCPSWWLRPSSRHSSRNSRGPRVLSRGPRHSITSTTGRGSRLALQQTAFPLLVSTVRRAVEWYSSRTLLRRDQAVRVLHPPNSALHPPFSIVDTVLPVVRAHRGRRPPRRTRSTSECRR